MWDRIRVGRSQAIAIMNQGAHSRPKRRSGRQPLVEALEDRSLMATLQPISNITVPAQQGYSVPLLASASAADNQTYTITSSNPNVAASIAQGPFWNLNVSYPGTTSPTESSPFTGTLTFQLFQNLTPNTVGVISGLTTSGAYSTTYKYFNRIKSGFPNATDFIVQGGSPTPTGQETTSPPAFANEDLQQLPFTGVYQLAMANSGGTDSNGSQFFITTGSPNAELGYNYTIFGQLLTGVNTLTQLVLIPTMPENSYTGEANSQPDAPPTITSATLTTTNPNGTAIIDASRATAGQTATITVTATDSVDHSTTSESFTVTVGAYAGPTSQSLLGNANFAPFASAVTTTAVSATPMTVQLAGKTGYPDTTVASTLSYAIVSQPAHGTITNFNATTGALTYTANSGYTGSDSFQYDVSSTGPGTNPASLASNPATVSISVAATPPIVIPPVNTGAVRVVGTSPEEVLIVTPLPRRDRGKNTIDVFQAPSTTANGGAVLETTVNGQLDLTQPAIGDLSGIVVYGGNRAKNTVIIDPSVTVPSTIDGGHGYKNHLTGGSVETREHGWFGHSVLVGGSGPNQLVGLAGHVKFKPSKSTNEIFAGKPHRRTALLNPVPPGGTFYKYVKGHLVVVLHNP
jgi:cyclophilin family peptidyl-prolyl cis-trans isomerase